MRFSRMFIPTVKETPSEAEVASHKLMIRAGLMRKLSSGTYSYLPLGFRCLQKVIKIVREEMNKAGAQEILLPAIQPMELWQQTGRDVDYGETMAKFTDRHGRENVIAPTAEEVVTAVVAKELNSYKQLPLNLYQVSFKFRDEFRPRYGVLRCREFIMKDAYSFHAVDKSLDESYRLMYESYRRIFSRCGLEYLIVEAESGEMGGGCSHQFTVPCESGEDVIVYTEDGLYAANIEKAAVDPLPRQEGGGDIASIQEVHTPDIGSIEDVCAFLKRRPDEMIKTLIYSAGGEVAAVLVRGDHEVNVEKLTQAVGVGHIELADADVIEKVTGAGVGFAGPVQPGEDIGRVYIDHAVAAMAAGVSGANRTDYHITNVVPGRDFALEGDNVVVADIRNAVEGDSYNGKKLFFKRGIEVGQVFKLGTKYASKLGCKFLDEDGRERVCTMGCYGIGINRIVAAAIENNYDEDGIIWPISIAPFEVLVTSVNQNDAEVAEVSERLYRQLLAGKADVLFDDRRVRGGGKFKDADLTGIPVRLTVGKRGLSEGNVEIKVRGETKIEKVSVDAAAGKVIELVGALKEKLMQ